MHRAHNWPDPWQWEQAWGEPQCPRPQAAPDRGALCPHQRRLAAMGGVTAPPRAQAAIGGQCNPLSTGCVTPPLHRRVEVRREGRDPRLPPALSSCTLPVSPHCTKVSSGQSTAAGAAPNVKKKHVAVHVTHTGGTKASWLIGDVKAGPAAEVQVRAAVGKGQNTVKPCLLRT